LVEALLLQLRDSNHSSGQLDVVLLSIQCLLGLAFHCDDAGRSRYLEIEVGVVGDGHELDVTWPSQDDMVWPGEVDHLEGERLNTIVARISESDMQIYLPEWGGLLAQDHSVERVRASLE
jgi:hypothetical protein